MDLPKLLKWERQIPDYYECDQSVLITSGCSFTANTDQTEYAASWPGFVKDRCNFDYCIDLSWPGVGNLFIKESIEYAVEHFVTEQNLNPVVLVMWSGLDRFEEKVYDKRKAKYKNQTQPCIDNTQYNRLESQFSMLEKSIELIQDLASFLEQKNISYAFTSYVNLLHPPYLPVRDTTHRFTDHKDKQAIAQVEKLFLPIAGMDYLYEHAFVNDGLSDDDFHPAMDPILDWTDKVLLPSLEQKGIIKSKQ
jgi:hypothetical protein